MQVKEILTSNVKSCRKGESCREAARILWENDCGCVPVVDGEGKVVAMITDRDICMAAYFQGRPLQEIPVESAMSRELWSCSPDDSLVAAERTLQMRQVRRLPVVDGGRRLQGVVSLSDIVRALAPVGSGKNGTTAVEVSETLAAICRPHGEDGEPPTVPMSRGRTG